MNEIIQASRYPRLGRLTDAVLTNGRWIFVPEGKPPASTTFQFLPNGRITGYDHYNEQAWALEADLLKIFNARGELTWLFTVIPSATVVALEGTFQNDPGYTRKHILFSLEDLPSSQSALSSDKILGAEPAANLSVRMVVWDLDETFWSGTLTEGEVHPIASNIEIINTLTTRGIINSVCSKNDFSRARDKLIEMEVWDKFVFPKIDFLPKGTMIKTIIDQSQFRTQSVLFIDDNEHNIAEALHHNPGLQVARPHELKTLLDDPRFIGKRDSKHSRLTHYKSLEAKLADRSGREDNNLTFLWNSDIRISFHYDVIEHFDRIHELVNRTNQLNFSKNRWPEDLNAAREAYERELASNFHSQSGYIRVTDKYGEYGICGFYLLNQDVAKHFLFSCRCLHMGVEQAVWRVLKKPHIPALGSNVGNLQVPVDWVRVVNVADNATSIDIKTSEQTTCLRGGCDLQLTAHYLYGYGHLVQELVFPFNGWAMFQPICLPAQGEEAVLPMNRDLLSRLPGVGSERFKSSIVGAQASRYIISFSQDAIAQYYQSRSTGLIIPLSLEHFGTRDLTTVHYNELVEKNMVHAASEEQWGVLRSDLVQLGPVENTPFRSHIGTVLNLLKGKTVVIVMLNDTFGRDKWVLQRFGLMNSIVRDEIRRLADADDHKIHIIEVADLIQSETNLTEDRGGPHYVRDVYRRIAERIAAFL